MKKFLIIPLSILFYASVAFGAVTYSRSPAGASVTSPVSFNVSVDDLYADTGIDNTNNYWALGIENDLGVTFTDIVTSSTLAHIFTATLAVGDYKSVSVYGGDIAQDILDEIGSQGNFLEGDNTSVIFSVVEGSNPMFSVATGTAGLFLGNLSTQLSDPGLLTTMAVAMAIYLVFWLIRALMGLFYRKNEQ